ncbi:MAG: aminoacyl-tRNA hydrolase [Rhodocyclaceae bacterium]|nr:aminoacyl-tRNA hydrolase [Rhodocyclaceae bacterium]MBK6909163.1 aminoacyl-tRNA hydrolase [Rhodocyclaceae bacterium]
MRRRFPVSREEVEFSAIRAQGAGGQNVNKVSNAAHLRFSIAASSLPDAVKARLVSLGDRRISSEGVVVIKAQEYRSLERNQAEALERLQLLVDMASQPVLVRRATQPTRASVGRRLEGKARRGRLKAARGPVSGE